MRLFCFVLLSTLFMPGLGLAQPEITDDISNQPALAQPESAEAPMLPAVQLPVLDKNVDDDSVEVVMPATLGYADANATLPDSNATLPDSNATLPNLNATVPAFNATLPSMNATLPQVNATLPVYNATLPSGNATLPQVKATQPVVNVTAPKPISVADFLVKTPEKKSEPVKTEPVKKEPPKPEPVKSAPQKSEKAKPEEKKPEPQKTASQKPTSGQAMKIPADAAKTGDVSFLEGCWRGYRPEYNSKRMVTERFCFDASGIGKRTIVDPTYAGTCYGATRALMNKNGVLHMKSQQAVCTNGEIWGASELICKGEGNETPCYWDFEARGSQSYKISFVRE